MTMRRWMAVTVVMCAVGAHAQLNHLPPGAEVRAWSTQWPLPVRGHVVSATDSLRLVVGGGTQISVAIWELNRVERLRGRKDDAGDTALLGAFTLGALGFLGGYLESDKVGETALRSASGAAAFGAIIGALTGTRNREVWRVVPLALDPRQVGLVLACRF